MTSEPPRKRASAWKILGIVVGVILVSILALYLWAVAGADRKLARLQERSRARLSEVMSAEGRRPVLRGVPDEGNAWDDYALAQAEVKKFPNVHQLGEIVDRTGKANPKIGKAALAAHGVAIDHLRRGAGRSAARYPYDWERGSAMRMPSLIEIQHTSNFGVLKVRALIDEGKPRKAAGVLLDLAQYGRDLGSDGLLISYMIGISLLGRALDETRDLVQAGKFDQGSLEDLERGLETLDRSFPKHGEAMLNDALLFGGNLEQAAPGGWWKHLLFADAAERTSDAMTAAAKTEFLPWGEAQKELRRIESDAQGSWNPLSRMTIPAMSGSASVGRVRRAQLRALRLAIHILATDQPLDLDDPFGTKMRSEEKGGALRIWSVGKDGVDDGGTGDWEGTGKDVLLEIKP